MTLKEVCTELQETISKEYDLGPGDAEDLFKMLWDEMSLKISNPKIINAIQLIDEELM